MILADGGESFQLICDKDSSRVLLPLGFDQHWNRGHSRCLSLSLSSPQSWPHPEELFLEAR